MKKFIFFLVIAAAILFAGKLGLEYYYGKKLDEFITQVSAFADVDYRKVTIATDGSISINNLVIEPHAIDTFVRMDAITLFSSDRLLPINLASLINRSEFPDELGVRIANMEYDPNLFEPTIQQTDKCRYIESTISAQLTGINRLNANIRASIQINANNGVISIASTDQIAEMNIQASFDTSLLNPASSRSSQQPFDEITAKYKLDQQIASFLIQTCANQLAMSTDEYLNNVVGSPSYLRSTGIDFGVDANQAMIDLMQGGKWLSIRSKPSSQLNNLNSLSFYQAEDIVRLLGLKVTIDSQEVALNITELQFNGVNDSGDDLAQSDLVEQTTETPLISAAQNDVLSKLSPEEQQRIKLKLQESTQTNTPEYSYRTTSSSNLNRYINYSVIFKRSGDLKQMAGELLAIRDDIFIIESSQYGGKAQFEINAKDVVEVQVYR